MGKQPPGLLLARLEGAGAWGGVSHVWARGWGVRAADVGAQGVEQSLLPRRTHPNLTKGFGLIGPKDFFPLLDFAFMPNNSLVPRCGLAWPGPRGSLQVVSGRGEGWGALGHRVPLGLAGLGT